MTSIWRPIPQTAGLGETAVLLKSCRTPDSILIQLTDLSQVWAEELNKTQICERARTIDCSIDPSEDDNQLTILLEKIEAALKGDDGTTLSVVADGPDHFRMELTSPLPDPLPPLQWMARLGPGSREQVKTEVMVPLVCSTYMRKQQEDNLVALLAAKDGLMSKMMDKIESLGVDLVSLFPQLGKGTVLKRKRNQREALAPSVPGLGLFNEAAWRTRFDSTVHEGVSFRNMGGIAFQESNTQAVRGLIDELDPAVFQPLPDYLKDSRPQRKIVREETLDGFQHQITPQKIRRRKARADRALQSDEGTSDDEGTISPTPKARPPRSTAKERQRLSATTTPASTKKLGTIGGSRKKVASVTEREQANEDSTAFTKNTEDSPSLHRSTARSITPPIIQAEQSRKERRTSTASASSASTASEPELDHQPISGPVTPTKKLRFGHIGADASQPAASATQNTVSHRKTSHSDTGPTSQPQTPRKLGSIGRRRPDTSQEASQTAGHPSTQAERPSRAQSEEGVTRTEDTQNDHMENSQRRPSTTPNPELPEESQDEKVIRRRRELEREMSQVRTTPKKKRRF